MGLREIRQTITDTADKLTATAADTKAAVIAVAVLAVVALAAALIALGTGLKARTA
jgi:hypothetical protein